LDDYRLGGIAGGAWQGGIEWGKGGAIEGIGGFYGIIGAAYFAGFVVCANKCYGS
jgi:hypothetical protein